MTLTSPQLRSGPLDDHPLLVLAEHSPPHVADLLAFWAVDRIASALLWPYLAWVTFAAVLNAALARLNPV